MSEVRVSNQRSERYKESGRAAGSDSIYLFDQVAGAIRRIWTALDIAGIPSLPGSQESIEVAIRAGDAVAVVVSSQALRRLEFTRFAAALGDQPRWLDTMIILIADDDSDHRAHLDALNDVATVIPVRGPNAGPAVVNLTRAALKIRRKARLAADLIERLEGTDRAALASTGASEAEAAERISELAVALSACSIAESELRAADRRNSATIELSDVMVFTADADGNLTSVDERYYEVTGADRTASVSPASDKARVHPDDRAGVRAAQTQARTEGIRLNYEYRGRVADGSYRWWQLRAAPIKRADGSVLRWHGTLLDIHDRKVAEERLRESEELHRFSLQLSDLVVWSATPDGIVTDIGNRLFEVVGITREQMFGGKMRDWLHPDDADRVLAQRRRSLADGTMADFDFRIRKSDSDYHWWRWRSAPMRDASGAIERWYGTLENIDGLRRAEEKLRASEQLHRYSVELSNLIVWTGSPNGEFLSLSPRIFRCLGLTRAMTASLRAIDLMHPDDLSTVVDAFKAGLKHGKSADFPHRLRHADGTYRWWRLRAAPLRGENGDVVRWYGTLEDIDDLQSAQQRLRKSEELYRNTIELSNQIVFTTTPSGQVITIGGNWALMTGFELDALEGSALDTRLCHPADAQQVARQRVAAYRAGLPLDQSFRMVRPDGTYRWWRLRASPSRDAGGRVSRWYGTIEDVDALHRVEAARQAADAVYRHTIEASGQLPWSASADGSAVRFHAMGADTGPYLARFDIAATGVEHPDDLVRVQANRRHAYSTGQPLDHAYRLLSNSGEFRWWRSRASPHRDENGGIIGWYGTLENVDAATRAAMELAKLQTEMAHMSRLSAMGAMASTLAHELNQPLAAVINYISGSRHLLSHQKGDDIARISLAMQHAEDCAIGASKIIRKVRQQVSHNRPVNADENISVLINDACAIGLADTEGLSVEVAINLDPTIETVYGDNIQLQQVLINFLRNAIDAVSTVDDRIIIISTGREGFFCAISVSDSGPGIADGMATRLFEPYETSKEHGLGIGLSISRTIAEAHGGRIECRAAAIGGACFTILLPISGPR